MEGVCPVLQVPEPLSDLRYLVESSLDLMQEALLFIRYFVLCIHRFEFEQTEARGGEVSWTEGRTAFVSGLREIN